MIYSPHTFEITLVPDTKEFNKLLSKAYKRAKKHKHRVYEDRKNDAVHIDEALKSNGITIKYQNDIYKKKIKFIVNPSRVLGGDDLKLWKPKDSNIKNLLKALEYHIDDYFDSKYELDDFKLTRMDFTVNIDVESRENVSAYIKVLYNMGKVKGFSLKYDKYDDTIDKDLSFDLEGNSNDIEFTVYDKEAESERKKAKGILRIEVKLKKPKAIRKYVDETDTSEQIKELSKNSRDIFWDTFTKIVPFGDYYKLKDAKKFVEDNISKKTTQKKMIQLLELIPKKKSLLLAQKELNDRNIDKIIKKFAEINVSPVTLSKRQKIGCVERSV